MCAHSTIWIKAMQQCYPQITVAGQQARLQASAKPLSDAALWWQGFCSPCLSQSAEQRVHFLWLGPQLQPSL